jgi:CheY-like chemotaxis protein
MDPNMNCPTCTARPVHAPEWVGTWRGDASADATRRGLGLALGRQMAHAMGGEITVQSTPGGGSTFTLTLSAADADAQPDADSEFATIPATRTQTPGRVERPMQVLYIEDEPVNMLVVRHILEHIGGVQLHEASSIAAGLTIAAAIDLDLILVDMNLPDGHGVSALPTLKAASRASDVSIVALSADAVPTSIGVALAAGFDDYLTKPVAVRTLERLLSELRSARHGAELAVPA